MTGAAAVAAWTGPAMVAAVVARVTLGGAEAPLFVLVVLAAPLLALLVGPRPHGSRSGLELAVEMLTAACLFGAGFRVVVDLGGVIGVEPGVALGASAVLVVVATVLPRPGEAAVAGLVLGAGAFVLAGIALGLALATPPWTAWSRVASRAAFELGARSPWTREGAHALERLTLTFSEPHRVVAVTPGVYRIIEHDRGAEATHDWRAVGGESVTLRPGDSLSMPAGSRIRLEAGKLVPLRPDSGVTWADRPGESRARLVTGWLGLAVTLVGGAMAIVRPVAPLSRSAAIAGPLLVLGVLWAATCWGIYAVDAAPELSFGAPAMVTLTQLAGVVADDPWRVRLLGAVVMALVALLVGTAAAIRVQFAALARRGAGSRPASPRRSVLEVVGWVVMVAAAGGASLGVADGWTLVHWGSGLAAAALLGPLLATGDAVDLGPARAKGALAGVMLFAAVAAATRWLPAPAAAALQYPALIAAPGAWLVAVAARREMVAATRRR